MNALKKMAIRNQQNWLAREPVKQKTASWEKSEFEFSKPSEKIDIRGVKRRKKK